MFYCILSNIVMYSFYNSQFLVSLYKTVMTFIRDYVLKNKVR